MEVLRIGRRKSWAIPRALTSATTQSRGVVQTGAPGNLANRKGAISFVLKYTAANMLAPERSAITVTIETIFCNGRRWFSTSSVARVDDVSRKKLATGACWFARSAQAQAKQMVNRALGKKRRATEGATPFLGGEIPAVASWRSVGDFTNGN